MKSIRSFKEATQGKKVEKLTSQQAGKITGGRPSIVIDRCPECKYGDID